MYYSSIDSIKSKAINLNFIDRVRLFHTHFIYSQKEASKARFGTALIGYQSECLIITKRVGRDPRMFLVVYEGFWPIMVAIFF